MQSKGFFDVFVGIKLDKADADLFGMVTVDKVTTNQPKTFINIYVTCARLIKRRTFDKVANNIVEQLFPDMGVQVNFVERFILSDQYTPEKIFENYMSSFEYEFDKMGSMMSGIFNRMEFSFKGETMVVKMSDNIVTQTKGEEIIDIIKQDYINKFGINLEVQQEVLSTDKHKYAKENELLLKNAVAEVSKNRERYLNSQENEDDSQENTSNMPEKEKKETAAKSRENNKNDAGNGSKKEKNNSNNLKAGKGSGGGREGSRSANRSNNPDVIWGRDFNDETIPIAEIQGDMGIVSVRGQIISVEEREIRGEKTIVTFAVTDFTDTICAKLFVRNEQLEELHENIKKGAFITVKGAAIMDTYDKMVEISSVSGIKKSTNFVKKRIDKSIKKRVELHCHTKMSDMDGVSDTKAIVKRAAEWGHRAIAITDHGVVQGFPDARHAYEDIMSAHKGDEEPFDFKVIYGVEAYLVDDLKDMISNCKEQTLNDTFVVFDIETTGFSPVSNKIIEIGAVKITAGEIVDRFSTFVNPEEPIPFRIETLTSINDEMVIDAPKIEEVLPQFLEFVGDATLVAHNAEFDVSFINTSAQRMNIETDFTVVDTVTMSRFLIPEISRYKLDTVAKHLKIVLENHHRAVDDAECTALIFLKLCERLKDRNIETLKEANELSKSSVDLIKKAPTYHAIILVKNNIGRVNLYKLISHSHIDYFAGNHPRIPKSDYLKHSEGLMIGSACEAGELFQAISRGKSHTEIARLAAFYDYYEIQPLGNNEFMVKTGVNEIDSKKRFLVDSKEDLINFNKQIVKLGKEFNKPVVATCDVHFLDPEDEVYRRIIQAGKGFKDADNQPPLYLRTTEEMLEEFSYLGSAKAEEVVITNTNLIADMIENISPIHPDKCPPQIENSDVTLRNICYEKAHSMYGDPLPKIVEERLEKELTSIIGNGFAVMYIMAQKLVWKSNEDGYLVGSRGSVGSSFVATMAGITEVNPLKPHYYCKKCKYSDFDSDVVNEQGGGSGFDLPDAVCPVCGEKLIKDGFDIPFETFLGFYGDKEPDIDLNFSGEYQANAHAYTEVMFGKGHSFRAGTITGVAEKTAYGYVKKYYEERGITKRRCEIERLAKGCEGIRRSSGQHPGGMVIVPADKEIYDFTPVQKPANDMTTDTITTHFEYHAIDRNLLKLDILGHDDPTMIRMLEDLTGLNAQTIPLDNPEVMSLFAGTEALGIKPEDIAGTELGSLGIPEFGTDFVIQMLKDTKPTKFADLVRISGLSHGTNVWLDNAQRFIAEGKATISTAICTRDDIMTFLISKGVESGLSFTIMESVRKGKGLKPEFEEAMRAADVPEWYIESCKLIKYMFPKAHAAAYVMMAYRIAYYKVFYPLAYYAAYFSIRAKAFEYGLMCQGAEKLKMYYAEYMHKKEMGELSQKDELTIKDMKLVMEMYARGFEFEPIDIYRAKAKRFQIIDGKLMASFNCIKDMGDTAAESLEAAAKQGTFLSKEDLQNRAKISSTNIEYMSELGLLKGLPEKNQISLFDLGNL